jgi:SAM-dependent methyltransferase
MTTTAAPSIFDRMSALTDPTRCRLVLLLERDELTVGELCATVQLPQSTVSRHLKVLADEGWVRSRAEGTTRRYRMRRRSLDEAARRLWAVVREQAAAQPSAGQDRQRLRGVLASRRERSREFFSTAAGEWDGLRAELFGSRADLVGLLGLLDDDWSVGDLGCGTGQVAEAVAPFVRRVVAVDDSPEMLAAARSRLDGHANVEVRAGDLRALPLDDGSLDAAVLSLVLHHQPAPADALGEVARVTRAGGRVLVIDMMPHEREEFRDRMGHVWLGFGERELSGWLEAAGFEAVRYIPLAADPAARGPTLFAAAARRARGTIETPNTGDTT